MRRAYAAWIEHELGDACKIEYQSDAVWVRVNGATAERFVTEHYIRDEENIHSDESGTDDGLESQPTMETDDF